MWWEALLGKEDLAAQVWPAEESTGCSLAGSGAQQGCGSGTTLGRWQNESAGRHQPPPAQPGLWRRGTAFIKDRCLSKERINSFLFDVGGGGLDLPCCVHQSCSCPLGTPGGEEGAELVVSLVSSGWCRTWMGCRAETPVPGY